MGGLGHQKFSTFGPSDESRKYTIEFHLMRAIAFYSPCFCLSNRVWHEQIVSCTIVTDPNNFKCHGTIFANFWHQKTHYFLERTHQNLTHRMHDATHCIYASVNQVSIGADNGLLPIQRQAIIYQCWVIGNWTLKKKLQWKCIQNTKLFIHKNVPKMSFAKWRPFCRGNDELSHWGLVTPYSDIDLGQQWFR